MGRCHPLWDALFTHVLPVLNLFRHDKCHGCFRKLKPCGAHRQAHVDDEVLALAQRELRLLKASAHPNVVRLALGAFAADASGRLCMAMEYVGSNLKEELKQAGGGLPAQHAKWITAQLLHAAAFLHGSNVSWDGGVAHTSLGWGVGDRTPYRVLGHSGSAAASCAACLIQIQILIDVPQWLRPLKPTPVTHYCTSESTADHHAVPLHMYGCTTAQYLHHSHTLPL